ncbi:E3 ubiquitin-protein ligase TRIM33 [Homalodisca vitripennis]|uniref:E3 ubiquitin-protein ligase TRIM33 n=1 Tax=Homalodisca vitripennis TaxID=197043 RepID=UPI001EEB97E5|nr:E3 ubiquitin-protein ligase TRIM33 [Homalodisca vitripennis]
MDCVQGQGQVSTPHNSRQHAAYSPAARQLVQRVQSPHSSNQQTGGGIQWHIPQQPPAQYGSPSPVHKPLPQVHAPPDDSYKITLKQPTPPAVVDQKPVLTHPPFVSSSVPKTPSPHTQAKAADDAEKSLDKFCQESVNDLMMTIAKLDSNGIMVIPEKGADSVVDSSTGPPIDRPSTSTAGTSQATPSSQGSLDSQKDDPNEDWCAVCLDGGEPVLCCDNCPKVFHLKCHIPSLSAFPGESETWQCLLCTSMSGVTSNIQVGDKRPHSDGLDSYEQMLMQRILLELYCQYEPSLHFREVIPADNLEYHEKIKRPMSF